MKTVIDNNKIVPSYFTSYHIKRLMHFYYSRIIKIIVGGGHVTRWTNNVMRVLLRASCYLDGHDIVQKYMHEAHECHTCSYEKKYCCVGPPPCDPGWCAQHIPNGEKCTLASGTHGTTAHKLWDDNMVGSVMDDNHVILLCITARASCIIPRKPDVIQQVWYHTKFFCIPGVHACTCTRTALLTITFVHR